MAMFSYYLAMPAWLAPILIGIAFALGFLWGRFESVPPELDAEKRRVLHTFDLPLWGVPFVIGGFVVLGYAWGLLL